MKGRKVLLICGADNDFENTTDHVNGKANSTNNASR